MKHITITITDIVRLNSIRVNLSNEGNLTLNDKAYLFDFLSQIPVADEASLEKVVADEPIELNVWEIGRIESLLKKWYRLFVNIPGADFAPDVDIIDQNSDPRLLHRNIIMIAKFSPSLAHNEFISSNPYEVQLIDDGTAKFWFPTFEDAQMYPELYNFKGSWKEAYYLLIETLKKGWPMEEFPEELRQFLKK